MLKHELQQLTLTKQKTLGLPLGESWGKPPKGPECGPLSPDVPYRMARFFGGFQRYLQRAQWLSVLPATWSFELTKERWLNFD